MAKKFKNEDEFQNAVHAIEWEARISFDSFIDEAKVRLRRARAAHNTSSLDDAEFILKLFQEKIAEHNGRCKQQSGRMKTHYYKRDNIEQ